MKLKWIKKPANAGYYWRKTKYGFFEIVYILEENKEFLVRIMGVSGKFPLDRFALDSKYLGPIIEPKD